MAMKPLTTIIVTTVLTGMVFCQTTPKDFYKEGEMLLKADKYIEAYKKFGTAASMAPTEGKFQKKRDEVGKLAAVAAIARARDLLVTDVLEAEEYMKLASEADSSNQDASLLQKQID